MKSVKGTETEKNLLKSFAGESQARNRYTYFAGVARKEGFVQIANIFEETANQEKEHAKRFFKFLEGGELEITASFPAGIISDTATNLKEAAGGEYDEWHNLYPAFAAKAREGGFPRNRRRCGIMSASPKSSMSAVTAPCSKTCRTAPSSRSRKRSSGAA